MGLLRYGLLGPLQVQDGDDSLPLGRRQQRAVLAILLVHLNAVVSTDELLEALWPENRPGKPLTAIHGYVSALRKLLGREAIQTSGGGYQLIADAEQVDSHRFERLLIDAREALAAEQPRQAAILLSEALGLWRGAALADFTYEEWAQPEIRRLHELRAAADEELAEAQLALGEHEQLIGRLEALVASDPLRERRRAQLMLALYRAGRQAEALDVYQQLRERLVEDLGVDPSPQLQSLYKQILNQDDTLEAADRVHATPTNLPTAPNRLIGRTRELEQIAALLLRKDIRLVSLTGPGGVGKTRLALQVAMQLIDQFPQGVFFVNLAPVADADLVLSTIAQTLDVKEQVTETILTTLAGHLRDRQMLLVLDNFEQVEAAAPTLAELLRATSAPKLIVTSRASLRLAAEYAYEAPALTSEEAVALFVERARAANSSFLLDGDQAIIEQICQRVDRLPLAIELAAARTKVLPAGALLERLSDRLHLLAGGSRDLPERQRTLRGMIEWSHGLLTRPEQLLFARLSVFVGGGTLTAIEEVVDLDGTLDVLEGITSLIDKSLLRKDGGDRREPRYVMLETIRDYASEQLVASGEAGELRRRHAEHCCSLVATAEKFLRGEMHKLWFDRLESELPNIRAAFAWCIETTEIDLLARLAASLARYWEPSGRYSEGRDITESALALSLHVPTQLRLPLLNSLAGIALRQGDQEYAVERLYECLELARAVGDQDFIANVTGNLGLAEIERGNLARAEELTRQGLALDLRRNDEWHIATSKESLAEILLLRGRLVDAYRLNEEAIDAASRVGDSRLLIAALVRKAHIHRVEDELVPARDAVQRALAAAQDGADKRGILAGLIELAAIASIEGDQLAAAELCGSAEAIRTTLGIQLARMEREVCDKTVLALRSGLGDQAFEKGFASGLAMTPDEAVALALSTRFASNPAER